MSKYKVQQTSSPRPGSGSNGQVYCAQVWASICQFAMSGLVVQPSCFTGAWTGGQNSGPLCGQLIRWAGDSGYRVVG